MATNISHTHTYCGMGMRDANISPGMRDDNSSPYICEIIYICEMGKRDDNIHMKRDEIYMLFIYYIVFHHVFNRWMEGSRGMAGTQNHCITIHIIARYF